VDEQLKNLIAQLKAAGVDTKAFQKAFEDTARTIGDSEKLLETMQSTLRGVQANARGLSGEFGSIRDNLAAALAELTKKNAAVNKAVRSYRGLTGIVEQLAQEEEGIITLGTKQLDVLKSKSSIYLQEMQLNAKRLVQEKAALGLQITANGLIDRRTEAYKNLSDKEKALLAAYEDGFSQEKRALKAIEQRAEKEKLVQKELGLTGSAVGGLATMLGKLGISGLAEEFDEIKKKLTLDFRKELESTKEEVISIGEKGTKAAVETYKENQKLIDQNQEKIDLLQEKDKLTKEEKEELINLSAETDRITAANEQLIDSQKVSLDVTYQHIGAAKKMGMALSAAGQMAKAAFDKVADPAVVLAFVGKSLLEGSSRAAKLQKELNISAVAAEQLKGELAIAANLSGSNFITSEKLTKSFLEMSKYIGQSAHMLGGEALKSATYLTEKMHLSADAAGQLVTMTRLTGRNTEETFKGMGDTLTKFNLTNKTAFSLKDIMNDIGNMSKATVLTLGKSPTALLKAAAAARKLGVSMEQLESIGESLLDFESSIEKEMEAQLLTGNSLNLSRARELAMMGDMEGLAKEVGNQEAIKNAFATKNVIAQKAAAEALGMSREQLAQMTYQQELNNLGAEKFKARYGEVAYESAKAQSAQDKFTDAIAKMQSILGDVIGAFSPIIDALAYIVSFPIVPYFMAAAVAAKALGGNPFAGMVKGIGAVRQGLAGYIKDVSGAKGVGEKIKSVLGIGDKTGGITKDAQGRFRDAKGRFAKNPLSKSMDKGAEATGKMQQKTKGAKGQGPKGFLKSLGDGLAHIGKMAKQVIKGAGALALSGVLIGGSFALALNMVKDVDPKVMLAFATSIGIFGGALALVSKQASNAIKGALAMGIIGVALIPAAYAFSLLEGVDPMSIALLTGSLLVLGAGAAVLGALSGNIIMGAAAIGILGLAMVPAAYAFSLLENVDTAKIIAFSIALPLLGLAAAGLGFIAPFIMAGASAIGVLGLAMIPLAGAFALLGAVDIQGVLGQLGEFAMMGPQLLLAGAGLLGLSAGLIAFSAALAGGSLVSGLTGLLGGGVIADLQTLADMAEPLATVGVSLTAIASGLAGIALALSTLETEKINELKGLVMTTAFAAPMVAASGAITELISGITGGGEDSSNSELLAEIKALRAAVEAGGDVYIDGNKAGNALMLASYKSS